MKRNQGKIAILFLLPYLAIFTIFRFIPSVGSILMSFFKWNLVGNASFCGLENFVKLFKDNFFYISLLNTLFFVLLTAPALVVISLALAVLFNQKLKLRDSARAVSIIPYVLIPAVVGIIWGWMFDHNFGILNYYLRELGLRPIGWLTDQKMAMISVAIVLIWSYLGYNTVLFLAGLQGISRELYESAVIDGATNWKKFTWITLPLLKPVASMIITLTLVNAAQVFDQIFVLTNGGPGTSTLTMIQYMYSVAFQNFDTGYGSTLEVAILVVLILLIRIQSKIYKVED